MKKNPFQLSFLLNIYRLVSLLHVYRILENIPVLPVIFILLCTTEIVSVPIILHRLNSKQPETVSCKSRVWDVICDLQTSINLNGLSSTQPKAIKSSHVAYLVVAGRSVSLSILFVFMLQGEKRNRNYANMISAYRAY